MVLAVHDQLMLGGDLALVMPFGREKRESDTSWISSFYIAKATRQFAHVLQLVNTEHN